MEDLPIHRITDKKDLPANLHYKTKDLVKALEKHKGMVSLAARELGCHPRTIYERAKKEQEIQDAIDFPRGEVLDIAEQRLREAIEEGNLSAITYTLSRIGKHRGYTERTELTGAEGQPLQIEQKIDIRQRILEYEKIFKESST